MIKKTTANQFIAFEGIDGSGKDTQLHLFIEAIRSENTLENLGDKYTNVWITREPTRITEAGKNISRLIHSGEKFNSKNTRTYFIEDRLQHSKIISAQLKHSYVLCSRYDLSTFAYQKTQDQNVKFTEIYDQHKYHLDQCRIPDLTIVLDLDAELALSRATLRNSKQEIFETKNFLMQARQSYFEAMDWWKKHNPDRDFLIVDATESIQIVQQKLIRAVNDYYSIN